MREGFTSLGLLFRLSALTLGAAFGSLLIGIGIDQAFGSAPFCTLGAMVLGIIGGTIAIYRSVQAANQALASRQTNPDPDHGESAKTRNEPRGGM